MQLCQASTHTHTQKTDMPPPRSKPPPPFNRTHTHLGLVAVEGALGCVQLGQVVGDGSGGGLQARGVDEGQLDAGHLAAHNVDLPGGWVVCVWVCGVGWGGCGCG